METKEFEKFKFLDCNREINQTQLSKIKKSIMEHGYIKSLPILVNENSEIIDGQHRFIACKELNVPMEIAFISNSDEVLIDLNTTQKTWGIKDYVHYYSTKNVKEYNKIIELSKATGVSNNLAAFILSDTETNLAKHVKNGTFRTDISVSGAIDLTCNIKTLSKLILGNETPKKLVRAVKGLCRCGLDIDELVMRCGKVRDKLYPCTSMEGYMKMLLDVYNYKNRHKVKIAI